MSTSLGWLGTGRIGAALAGRLIDADERVLSRYHQQTRKAGLEREE